MRFGYFICIFSGFFWEKTCAYFEYGKSVQNRQIENMYLDGVTQHLLQTGNTPVMIYIQSECCATLTKK